MLSESYHNLCTQTSRSTRPAHKVLSTQLVLADDAVDTAYAYGTGGACANCWMEHAAYRTGMLQMGDSCR